MNSTPGSSKRGASLGLAYQEFVRELREAQAGLGFGDLGRSDGFVFRALGSQPMTVSELIARLQISKQGAGRIVDDMERRGYVERHPEPDDGRARLLHLSGRGRAALAAARRFHQRYERRLARARPGGGGHLRQLLEGIAGPEQAVDPRLRAMYL